MLKASGKFSLGTNYLNSCLGLFKIWQFYCSISKGLKYAVANKEEKETSMR